MATVASIEYHTEGGRFSDAHLLITFTVLDTHGGPVSGASLSFELFRDGSSYLTVHFENRKRRYSREKNNEHPKRNILGVVINKLDASGLQWDGYSPENGFSK
jgi:ABC-type uncharacterized transport system substrate-binding protein